MVKRHYQYLNGEQKDKEIKIVCDNVFVYIIYVYVVCIVHMRAHDFMTN